ncbi:CCAAT-binding factor complex subunit Php4 [Schizosaccharomyces cryophilus OY26]|uniref:CCAAT-binding factor complex subunit Php4 n=1 Tax=Schizosaccharomyces cryophilus (strain OY26 / ATCC MYA-4695 / CBS 11777 / NBRC 106824 / NRRL Y48691) TaxID=653667 RepID=S9XKH8_SCHCR|nr:CCAAT-binding factor complex subunit Php4 [Schizosaccharomyces cryophilus OY26]EPY54221.1 CCAAT-binding factor complex subunit Php4 [Schizosaccharomyces cryophilus OY26]
MDKHETLAETKTSSPGLEKSKTPTVKISKQWVVPPRPKPGRKPALNAQGKRKVPIKPKPDTQETLTSEQTQFHVREEQYQEMIGKLQQQNNRLMEQLELLQKQLSNVCFEQNITPSSSLDVSSDSNSVEPPKAYNAELQRHNCPVQPPCSRNAVYTEVPIELDPHVFLGDSLKRVRLTNKQDRKVLSKAVPVKSNISTNEINFTPENPVVTERIRKTGICNGTDGCLYSSEPMKQKRARESDETKIYAQLLIDLHNSAQDAPTVNAGPSIEFFRSQAAQKRRPPILEPNPFVPRISA